MDTAALPPVVRVPVCPLHAWLLLLSLSTALAFLFKEPLLPSPLPAFMNLPSRLVVAAPALTLGVLFNFTAKRALDAAGGTPKFGRAIPRLVTEGPFQWTRNPLYVAGAALTLAHALIINSAWPAVLLLPWLAYVHFCVIPREEAVLGAIFPDEYKLYSHNTPRWLVCTDQPLWRS